MKTLEEYAKLGEHHDIMDALSLLTKAYINMCGYSLGYRTIVYCAGEAWKEKLAWLDLPLSEMARNESLVTLMPHISCEYNPELYDEYDISGMSEENLVSGCKKAIIDREFDDTTLEVLCWGILKVIQPRETLSKELEATAPDGTLLRGILVEQGAACTSVTMLSPYKDLVAIKAELVRDARELLVKAYEDSLNLHKQEEKIRALYSLYQDEFRNCKNESNWKKYHVFGKVYGHLVDDTVIVSLEKWFFEWFGLEFYDDYLQKEPSWM